MENKEKKIILVVVMTLVVLILVAFMIFYKKDDSIDNNANEDIKYTINPEKVIDYHKVDFAILVNGKGNKSGVFNNPKVENVTSIGSEYYGKEIKVENGKIVISNNKDIIIGKDVIGLAILNMDSFLYLNNKNEVFKVDYTDYVSKEFDSVTKVLDNVVSITTVIDEESNEFVFYKDTNNDIYYLVGDSTELTASINVKYIEGTVGFDRILLVNDSTVANNYAKVDNNILKAKNVYWGFETGTDRMDETFDTIFIVDENDYMYVNADMEYITYKKLNNNKVKTIKINDSEIKVTFANGKVKELEGYKVY